MNICITWSRPELVELIFIARLQWHDLENITLMDVDKFLPYISWSQFPVGQVVLLAVPVSHSPTSQYFPSLSSTKFIRNRIHYKY